MNNHSETCSLEVDLNHVRIKASGPRDFVIKYFFEMLEMVKDGSLAGAPRLEPGTVQDEFPPISGIGIESLEWVKTMSSEMGMNLTGIETKVIDEKGILVPKHWPERETSTVLYQELARVILIVNKYAKNMNTIKSKSLFAALRYIDPDAPKSTIKDALAAISDEITPVKEHGKKRASGFRLVARGTQSARGDLETLMSLD